MLPPSKGWKDIMYRQFGHSDCRNGFAKLGRDSVTIAQSGQRDALVALERIGTRLSCSRNDEIYAEGDSAECWYKVVSGTVRVRKLLADGRRHIAEFCFSGDCFGVDGTSELRGATEQLIDQNSTVTLLLRDRTKAPSSCPFG